MPFFINVAKLTSLKILVFGPNPGSAVANPHSKAGKLAQKRIDIRDWLVSEGHDAQFPEDIYQKTAPAPFDSVMYQEMVMMRQSDFIVVIVDSPGSNVELGAISTHSDLAAKTHAFIDETFKGGLAHDSCRLVSQLNGLYFDYRFPADIDGCHLKARVMEMASKIQLIKYLA